MPVPPLSPPSPSPPSLSTSAPPGTGEGPPAVIDARTLSRAWQVVRRGPWFVMMVVATLLALFSLHYLRPGMPEGFVDQLPVFRAHAPWFLLHVVGAALALALGPWQVLQGLRARRPALHRWLGRLYVAGVAAGGVGGLYLSMFAFGGPLVSAAFLLLAVLWLLSTGIALQRILVGRVAEHRRWMLRSLALTLAAVTQRLWLVSLIPLFGFETAYQASAWLAWVPNLILIEWWLRRRTAGTAAAASRGGTAEVHAA